MRDLQVRRQQGELLSWQLVAALLERLPAAEVFETHAGGGQYDCLTVRLVRDPEVPEGPVRLVDVNREGSVHASPDGYGSGSPVVTFEDLEHGLSLLEAAELTAARLLGATVMPATADGTAHARRIRALAALLASGVGRSGGHWECRSGFLDTSGDMGCRIREEWFTAFPELAVELGVADPEAATQTWFIRQDHRVLAALQLGSGQLHVPGDPVCLDVGDWTADALVDRLIGCETSVSAGTPAHNAAERRQRFALEDARRLARQLEVMDWPVDVGMRTSATVCMLGDTDRLMVAVGPGENRTDIDTALAWGLAFQQDRDLLLVLPAGTEHPTLNRLPWIATPVRVFSYDADLIPRPAIVPAREQVLADYRLQPVRNRADHALGVWEPAVEPLVHFAATHWALRPAHRRSYLAWHCQGRQVLRLRRTRTGVEVLAGVQYSKPTVAQPAPVSIIVDSPLTLHDRSVIESAVSTAVRDRFVGSDDTDREHALPAALAAAGAATLGLREPLRREYPAWRPVGHPAYLDFLGHDGQTLHIVETKLGNDPMLVLQALDYWTWVSAHQQQIGLDLGVRTDHPAQIDLVVASPNGTAPALGPYTLPQLEALDGAIRWRIHIATQDGPDVSVKTFRARANPDPALAGRTLERPRQAARMQTDLLSSAGLRPADSPILRDVVSNVLPAAADALHALVQAGLDHRYLAHVRSSQAFALNLFAPLTEEGRCAALVHLGLPAVSADAAVFEYIDPDDRLGEATTARRHQTQVDVVLRGHDMEGNRLAALIEVKLTEIDFGWCSGYEARGNDRQDICHSAGPFGHNPQACFQLRNRDLGQPRQYAQHVHVDGLNPLEGADDSGGCVLRHGLNQPMRNVALANVLAEGGERVVYALCAPAAHPTIWRRWGEARAVFGNHKAVVLGSLPAEVLLPLHPDGEVLRQRYQLLNA